MRPPVVGSFFLHLSAVDSLDVLTLRNSFVIQKKKKNVNLMMREQTLISGFAARFCFGKLTLGVMPISTRRSRASTFQISPRLSQIGTMVTFAFDTSFLRHTTTS